MSSSYFLFAPDQDVQLQGAAARCSAQQAREGEPEKHRHAARGCHGLPILGQDPPVRCGGGVVTACVREAGAACRTRDMLREAMSKPEDAARRADRTSWQSICAARAPSSSCTITRASASSAMRPIATRRLCEVCRLLYDNDSNIFKARTTPCQCAVLRDSPSVSRCCAPSRAGVGRQKRYPVGRSRRLWSGGSTRRRR